MSFSVTERRWTAHGLECAVLLTRMGHRCGYVSVPEGHPFHGLGYSDQAPTGSADYQERSMDDAGMGGMIALLGGQESVDRWASRVEAHVAVHGGLTFSSSKLPGCPDGWWFGFDCAHAGDSSAHWTEERVAQEVERMAEQLAAIGGGAAT